MTSNVPIEISPAVRDLIRRALDEDIGNGDVTSGLTIPSDQRSKAVFLAKEGFVVAGMPFVLEVFSLLDPGAGVNVFYGDGSRVRKGDIIADVTGRTRVILAGERVSLNFLQRLSGIATLTQEYVRRVKDCKVRILDTRKTTPGLRFMEKYAVRVGGGQSHRFGLFDGILIKDNHISAAGSISDAIAAARQAHHLMKIEVEIESLKDLQEALKAGADVVMLDNMSVEDMRSAVKAAKGRVLIEASGNMSLDRIREVAETGVDLISVGALTHSARAVDISLKIVR